MGVALKKHGQNKMAQIICSSVKHLFFYWDSNKKKW